MQSFKDLKSTNIWVGLLVILLVWLFFSSYWQTGAPVVPYSFFRQQLQQDNVAKILQDAYTRAVATLSEQREAMDRLVERLFEEEEVSGDVVFEITGQKKPQHSSAASEN